MAQIVLDHADKVYAGGVKALDDLNLEVREGELFQNYALHPHMTVEENLAFRSPWTPESAAPASRPTTADRFAGAGCSSSSARSGSPR
jgi:ABC-type sugar transport system ATPase subunit